MKMKRNHILCLSILLAAASGMPAMAQDDATSGDGTETVVVKKKAPVVRKDKYPMMEVKGTVIDAATGLPLAGVQVQTLNDIHYTAMTNDKGEFTIKVPTFATALYVHTPQYLSQQVPVSQDGVKVKMLADRFKTMYGTSTDILADRTMTVNHTTSQSVDMDVENALGADVRAISRNGGPGYGAAMFIRGINSLNANAQPLFVVDGIVRDMMPTRNMIHYGDYNNLLLNINPDDIDKVQVLKNGTALYGAKGGNGVILITTKRGHSMATRIDANIGLGVTTVPQLPDMMNASEYRLYASEMLGTYPNINNKITPDHIGFLIDDPTSYYYNMYHNNTDWTKEVYHTAMTQNYSINVQGGDNIGMYNLSLGYTDAQSTARKNGFNRLNVRFNTDINVIRHLTTRFDMAFAKINRNVFDNGAAEDLTTAPVSSPTFLGLIKSPILSPYTYNSNGTLSNTLAPADNFLTGIDENLTLGNPTALLANGDAINKNRVENTQFYAVIAPTYEFSKSLKLTETFNYTLDRISQRYYRPINGMPTFLIEGLGRVQNMSKSAFAKQTSIMSDTRLQWTKQFGAHFLDIYGGFRYTSFAYDTNDPTGQYSTGGSDKQPNISANMTYTEATGVDDTWKSASWYANVDYNYRNRYFVNATLTAETSSRFGENSEGLGLFGVKWGIFPSIQLGWNMTNESWFPKNSFVNYLLLRAGYDISGNDDISNYAARTSFTVGTYLNRANYAQLTNIGNDKITYEKTGKFNVGFQSYLFDNRIGLSFDFYKNHTSNLLTLKTFDNPVAGINNYWSNGGSLDNTGFEVALSGKPVVTKNFNVELGASLGHYSNKIKSLPNDTKMWLDG
ncbi:MAG TPA: SusC/RagA family TonB-linked outer membrane protein, partial [Prevotella sp.]|nr:SusC/RagA family TonB-linked outer membrane protein [Prevotella sp.]